MKRIPLFVFALALTLAPMAAHGEDPQACLELKKVKIADHVLHQQGETQAELTLKVNNCEIIEDHQQTTVSFESKPGLEVALENVAFHRPNEGESSNQVKELTVTLKLTASPELPVGESTLHGTLTYQAINGGPVAPETVALNIPFKVAPPKPPKTYKEPSGFVKGLEVAGEIVVGIIALPIMLIYCPLSGQCPDC